MQQYVEQIKEILQPSAIIGRKVLLKFKSNGEYLGLCPFHLEKTPSFTVSDRKKFFHCFGCGESGDIFTFLIKLESVSYKEALRRLADEAGITLPNADEFKVSQEEKDKLSTFFNIHATLAEFYHNYLFSSYGQEAREYIKNRGITLELAKKAMLGFAPQDSKSVVNFLGKSFNHEAIVGSKILIYKNNSFYNHLSGRIIFPIHDSKNRVIAFGGRIINHGNPKYINSSDSPIFKKSDNLYGLNFINKIHAKSKKIVLVEGYLDVLAVLPYANAVAPLGTSLSISQIKKLWHISENPIICFDRDDAGKNASYRVAKEILSCITPTCSLSFATLSKGKDPDESIKKHGPQFFLNDLEKAIPLADFLFLQERDKSNIATPEGRVDFKQKLDRLVSQIENFEVQKSYKYYFLEKYKRQFSTFNKKQVSKELDVQNLKNITTKTAGRRSSGKRHSTTPSRAATQKSSLRF